MPRSSGNQKLRLFCLYKLFLQETDEAHPKTRKELCEMLESRHGITVERKTFYDDLALFETVGIDIAKGERKGSYFLASKDFEMPELHLLVDAIQSSQFITEKKSRALIEKLAGLCSHYEGKQIKSQVRLSMRNKTINESIFYNIDALYDAITDGKQVSFLYFNWDIQNGKLCRAYRKDGIRYQVSPVAIVWDDEKYYLIAYDSRAEGLRHYRIDKMESLQKEEAHRAGGKIMETFDSGEYTAKHFGMYGGQQQQITLRFKKELLGVAVDQFGKNAALRPEVNGDFLLIVNVAVSPQFFGWLCSLEDGVEIVSPADARNKFADMLQKITKTYQQKESI
ncbi:MAG: WYL domain-containing protein [Clostridia bacterium]|nr:WYL domain-containing protein [Clostridia bacterium]